MKLKPVSQQAILFVVLSVIAAACSTPTPSSTPSSTPSAQTSKSTLAASPITETVEIIPAENPGIPDLPLSIEGPWWVFSTPDGLFAINPDGSGLTQFYFGKSGQPYMNNILAAPDGGYVAYITATGIHNVTLRITSFPGYTLINELPLTSDQSEPGADAVPGDPEIEAVRAMTENLSMAFSPDGRFLAFMGAIEGQTSDLYLYTLENNQTTPLSSGPSQAFQPVWSPDGKYIVHTGASTFGTGAGYAMEGIWAAKADDSGMTTLYDLSESSFEQVIGWVDNQTFVVTSWNPDCGSNNLRTFNIETSESTELWPGSFNTIAFDPATAVAIIGVNYLDCGPNNQLGLFRVPTDGSPPRRIVEDKATRINWSPEANLFLASTEFGTIAIDSNGQFIDLNTPQGADAFPAVAPGSRDLAWSGDALWIGPLLGSIDHPPQEIFSDPVYEVTWDPDGKTVLFFADRGIYIAQRPDFIPLLVAEGLDNRNGYSGWVIP